MSVERQVLERSDAWQRAIEERDADAAGAILADDYALVVTHPELTVMQREEWLRLLPDYDVHGWETGDRTVSVGDGIVSIVQRVELRATVAGVERNGLFVVVDLWLETDDGWRVWRRHSTPLDAGRIPRA